MRSTINVVILGSTGSVGTQTLDVIALNSTRFSLYALCAGKNITLLKEQIERFNPRYAVVQNEEDAQKLRMGVKNCCILCGKDAEADLASAPDTDVVVIASSSLHPLPAFYAAAKAGKKIAISNKETIVACGDQMLAVAKAHGATVIPVDSEHNAVFQCLIGENNSDISSILLTASGGAFRDLDKSELSRVTAKQALAHPNWKMGAKITIDCATLANKGLEYIEAMRLFDVPADKVSVVMHRESIIHSMVRFSDGNVKAVMSVPDMRTPISYALNFPQRVKTNLPDLDFTTLSALHFSTPDTDKFPCLALAISAAHKGGIYPLVFTSANDVSVEAFMRNKIGFYGINYYTELALSHFGDRNANSVDEILALDAEIKAYVLGKINQS